MLTSKQIEQSEKLTEEYGKPDCRNPAFDSTVTSPTATPDQVARELVDELFTDSKGRKAERLCLYDDQQYLGGWSKQPIIDRITTALEARDAEIERLKAELDEARREILIYLETRIPAALEATAKAEREHLRNKVKQLTNHKIEGRLFVLLDEVLAIAAEPTQENQNHGR